MVSSTLCPAVHILGSQNVYSRAEGIADHYWPWAVFFLDTSSHLYKRVCLSVGRLVRQSVSPLVMHFFLIPKLTNEVKWSKGRIYQLTKLVVPYF